MSKKCEGCSLMALVERIQELEDEVAALKIYKPAQLGKKVEQKAPIGETNFEYFGVSRDNA